MPLQIMPVWTIVHFSWQTANMYVSDVQGYANDPRLRGRRWKDVRKRMQASTSWMWTGARDQND